MPGPVAVHDLEEHHLCLELLLTPLNKKLEGRGVDESQPGREVADGNERRRVTAALGEEVERVDDRLSPRF